MPNTPNLDRFTFDRDYRVGFAETADPRVVAILQRDEYPDTPDGDCYAPTYWASPHDRPQFVTGYDDDGTALSILGRFTEADSRFSDAHGWGMARVMERWLAIFHGTAIRIIETSQYRNDTPLVMLDTPEWRKHVGIEGGPSKDNLTPQRDEFRQWLDGEVYAVGYAVSEARTTTETPIDLDDPAQGWETTIDCWGFIGGEYAAEQALSFGYGTPTMHPLLDGTDPADTTKQLAHA